MDSVYTEVLNGLTISIFQDPDPQSPNDCGDDGLFLIGLDSRNFYVKPPKPYDIKSVHTETQKTHWCFPVEAYIHSGVALALAAEGDFPDRQWDVCGNIGAVFVSKKEWRTRAKAREAARGHVETWNDYLSGQVYGYEINPAPAGEIYSCWGFYGDYDAPGGVLSEARAIVKAATHDGKTDANGQYLFPWAAERQAAPVAA